MSFLTVINEAVSYLHLYLCCDNIASVQYTTSAVSAHDPTCLGLWPKLLHHRYSVTWAVTAVSLLWSLQHSNSRRWGSGELTAQGDSQNNYCKNMHIVLAVLMHRLIHQCHPAFSRDECYHPNSWGAAYIPFLATHLRGLVASCLLQSCLHRESGVGSKVWLFLKGWRGQNYSTSGLARHGIAAHSFTIVTLGWGCTARRYWQGNRSWVCVFWWGNKD